MQSAGAHVLMAAATALALSGCTFRGDRNGLAEVASETRAAGTARVTRTLAAPRYGSRKAIGFVDFGRSRARLSTREYGIEELIDGRDAYVQLPGEDEWIKTNGDHVRSRLMWGDPLAWIDGLRDAEVVEELDESRYRARVGGIDAELWTDDSGRASRIRYFDATDARVTIQYAEFGVDTSIEAPAAGSVITSAEHQRRARRQARELLRLSERE
jgi:hypothetical protein